MDSLQWPLNFDLCSWLDFPSDAQIFAETSEDGTLMLRECVENAAESEFKCEMKEGEQGRVSFLLDSTHVSCMRFRLSKTSARIINIDHWSCLIDIPSENSRVRVFWRSLQQRF